LIQKYDDGLTRCSWPGEDKLYLEYHDTEWGVPLTGDQELFERICLEGFQAGLSWITILKRREGFRRAFKNFDFKKVAKFGEVDIERLMQDTGIIRNRAKIVSAVHNAELVLQMQKSGESISDLLWQFAPPKSKRTTPAKDFKWVAVTAESKAISKELRARGFSFVGPTTMYALMQSIGMVNDHAPGCFRRKKIQ
jgi:DNA-3-methyladenine glycosylase I